MRTSFFLIFFMCICAMSSGQVILKGIVLDSLSMHALSDVNITINGSSIGTFTDPEGKFILIADKSDTIKFTRIGYYPAVHFVRDVSNEFIIKLSEQTTMLRTVILTSDIEIPKPELPKETIWKHPHIDVGNGIVNVFGPGVTIPFYKIFKNKEKLSIEELKQLNELTRTYVQVVSNPETKYNLTTKYTLTESQYYETMTLFNEVNTDIMYYLTEIELLVALDNFFSNHTNN